MISKSCALHLLRTLYGQLVDCAVGNWQGWSCVLAEGPTTIVTGKQNIICSLLDGADPDVGWV